MASKNYHPPGAPLRACGPAVEDHALLPSSCQHPSPQRLLMQRGQWLDQIEHVDHQLVNLEVFGRQNIQCCEVLRTLLQVSWTCPLRLWIRPILGGGQCPGRVNDLCGLLEEGGRQSGQSLRSIG